MAHLFLVIYTMNISISLYKLLHNKGLFILVEETVRKLLSYVTNTGFHNVRTSLHRQCWLEE